LVALAGVPTALRIPVVGLALGALRPTLRVLVASGRSAGATLRASASAVRRLGGLDAGLRAPSDRAFGRLPERLGHEVAPALVAGLVLLQRDREGLCVRIVATARNLPRDACTGRSARDREPVAGDFLADVQPGRRQADRGELIAKRLVQRLEPGRQLDPRSAAGVQRGNAIVEVLHVRRFDE